MTSMGSAMQQKLDQAGYGGVTQQVTSFVSVAADKTLEVGGIMYTASKEKITELSQNQQVQEITEKSKQKLMSVGTSVASTVAETSTTMFNKVKSLMEDGGEQPQQQRREGGLGVGDNQGRDDMSQFMPADPNNMR